MLVPVRAQAGGLIRDTEIEETLRLFAAPLLVEAGLPPGSVQIHLINDSKINAFVAGGLHLFINTGLILRSKEPGEVIAVIAHEIGHMEGGHLARRGVAMRNASAATILTTVLGALAMAAGDGEAGMAAMTIGRDASLYSFLGFTRAQESSADQAAMRLMDATGQSSRGMLSFMELLEGEDLLSSSQSPYLRTHPLTSDRVSAIRHHVRKSALTDAPTAPDIQRRYARMYAKLHAFTIGGTQTGRLFPASSDALDAQYARAIESFRRGDTQTGLHLIDGLIADNPKDPYFHELRGQILFEGGRPAEAIPSYERAIKLKPEAYLIRVDLARALVATEDASRLPEAIGQLEDAVQRDPTYSRAWRELGIAYGRAGQMGPSSAALAEEALLNRRLNDARYHADRAENLLPRGSKDWRRLQDLKVLLQQLEKDRG
ncbi:MAG: M48 family metalloprotease [Magnetospiraceae bacterium]